MSIKVGDRRRFHVCDDCQYRQHGTMIRPSSNGNKSIYCHACGHLGIGSEVDCVVGDWLKVEVLGSNYYPEVKDES